MVERILILFSHVFDVYSRPSGWILLHKHSTSIFSIDKHCRQSGEEDEIGLWVLLDADNRIMIHQVGLRSARESALSDLCLRCRCAHTGYN